MQMESYMPIKTENQIQNQRTFVPPNPVLLLIEPRFELPSPLSSLCHDVLLYPLELLPPHDDHDD